MKKHSDGRAGLPDVRPENRNRAEKALDVLSASVLYNASKAKVEFDESKTSAEDLVKIITGLGYQFIKY